MALDGGTSIIEFCPHNANAQKTYDVFEEDNCRYSVNLCDECADQHGLLNGDSTNESL